MARFVLTAVLRLQNEATAAARRAFAEVAQNARKANAAFGRARQVGRLAAEIGGVAGVSATLISAGRRVLRFEDTLDSAATQASLSSEEVDSLRDKIIDTSDATGLTKQKLVDAVDTLTGLGGAGELTADNVDLLGRGMRASGAEGKSLAGVMFALEKQFFDGSASAEEMEAAMSGVLEAGARGSIPLKDVAKTLQGVGATFKDVTAGGVAGAVDLAAALQAARTAFGSPEETATGLRAGVTSLIRGSTKLRDFGVRVFKTSKDGKKELRPLRDIMDQIAQTKLARNPKLLLDALGSQEAVRFLGALRDQRSEWDRIADAAGDSQKLQEDFARRMSSQPVRIAAALERMKNKLDSAFTPERIALFADSLGVVLAGVNKVVDGLEVAGEALGSVIAAATIGSERQLERDVQREASAPQLLREQATIFGTGGVARNQRRRIAAERGGDVDVTAEAARQIALEAESRGLVRGGEVDRAALGSALGLDEDPGNDDIEAQVEAIARGVERALSINQQVGAAPPPGFAGIGQLPAVQAAPNSAFPTPLLQDSEAERLRRAMEAVVASQDRFTERISASVDAALMGMR